MRIQWGQLSPLNPHIAILLKIQLHAILCYFQFLEGVRQERKR